jgi:hypothetical protein
VDRTEPGWFSRNWKWLVPSGCLVMALLVVGFVAAIMFFVFSMMKSNDAYAHALETARNNPAVVATLGQPIEEGMFVTGNFEENGASGTANFAIPLNGPKGAGKVYVEARKSAGQWTYAVMVFESEATKQRIDLLQNAAIESLPDAEPAPEPAVEPAPETEPAQ